MTLRIGRFFRHHGEPARQPDPPTSHHQPAAPPAAPAGKRGLGARVKQAVMSKPFELTVGLPGNQVKLERPGRTAPPARPAAPGPQAGGTGADPVIAECKQVAERAEAILRHAVKPPHTLFDRPGKQTFMEKLASNLPWFKVKELKTFGTLASRPLSSVPQPVAAPAALAANHTTLVADLAQRADAHGQAMAHYHTADTGHRQLASALAYAQQQLAHADSEIEDLAQRVEAGRRALEADAAKPPHDSHSFSLQRIEHGKQQRLLQASLEGDRQALRDTRTRQAGLAADVGGLTQQVAASGARLTAASSGAAATAARLHSMVHVAQLHDVAGAVLSADIARQHLQFVHGEIQNLRRLIDTHLDHAINDFSGASALLQQHSSVRGEIIDGIETARADLSVQQDQVRRLQHDLAQAGLALDHAAVRATALRAQLAGSPGEHGEPDRIAAQLAALDDVVPLLQRFKQDTQTACDDASHRVAASEAEIARLAQQAGDVDSMLDDLVATLHTAAGQRGSALATLDALLEPAAELHADVELAATRHAEALAVFDTVQTGLVEQLVLHPPGFAPSPAVAELGQALRTMLDGLPRNRAADAVPRLPALELITAALAEVSGGDAARALALLRTVCGAPTVAFIARAGGESSSAPPSAPPADVRALFGHMGPLSRGVELLHLMGANDGRIPDARQLDALRTYWRADRAIASEAADDVKAWLGAARDVAAEHLHWTAGPAEGGSADLDSHLAQRFDQRHVGAYNAVRNELLSNAAGSEYDQHNQRLLKMTEQWVARARQRFTEACLGGLSPLTGKTPFGRDTLKLGAAMAESFGLVTHRTMADRAVRASATALAALASTLLADEADPAPATRGFNTAVRVLAQYIGERDVAHDSAQDLTRRDFKKIGQRYLAAMPGATELPPALRELAADAAAIGMTTSSLPLRRSRHGLDASEVLRTVTQAFAALNAGRLSQEQQTALAGVLGLDQAADHFRQAAVPRFEHAEDLLRYFEPMLAEWGTRERLRLAAGGALGAGLPFLPYVPPKLDAFLSVVFGFARKDEAFLQIQFPFSGIEMMVGESKTLSGDATVTAGKIWTVNGKPASTVRVDDTSAAGGLTPAPAATGKKSTDVSVGVTAALKYSKSDMTMEGTIVRFARIRGQEAAQRASMRTVLESVVLWDRLRPANSSAGFGGPVEALLSRSPDAVLTRFEGQSESHAAEAKLNAIARFRKATGATTRMGAGVTLAGALKAERILDRRTETAAGIHFNGEKASTAKQTASVSAEALVPLPENSSTYQIRDGKSARGTLGNGSVPATVSAIHEALQHLQRHAIAPYRVANKQEGQLDRYYFTPKEMLAEIVANRGQWLACCVQTLPAVAGSTDTPHNRAEAVRRLDRFVATITDLGTTSNYCQYNLNFSLRPQAAAWIDSLNHLDEVAKTRGDSARQAAIKDATDAILQQESTWQPRLLIVRERGKEAHETGINYGLRLQKVSTVETQRLAAQYP